MMNLSVEQLVRSTRDSLIKQLQSANALYDIVRELSEIERNLPPEQIKLKEQLKAEALKIYNLAAKISDESALIGKNLAEMVG